MPALLKFVPDSWGPKFGTDSGAVAQTCTGPNEIAFKAPAHMALVMFTPQPDREIALNSDRKTKILAPVGTIELVPNSADLFARWAVDKENLLVAIEQTKLSLLAGLEFQNGMFELRPPRPGFIDKRALFLANLIREEFKQKEAQNALYFDALITLFSTHLLRNYSSFYNHSTPQYTGGLSPKVWRTMVDYIQNNLSQDLSITSLANTAGLSPNHFMRAFKRTSGQSPHQYVIAQRLTLVERLSKATDRPFSEIAESAGFSSISHMTATMRRLKGITPSNLRSNK